MKSDAEIRCYGNKENRFVRYKNSSATDKIFPLVHEYIFGYNINNISGENIR